MKWFLVGAYVASIVAANLAVIFLHPFPVLGVGPMAPAGVYIIGLTLCLRDSLQDYAGKRATWALMLLGVAISAAFSGDIALASGAAFLFSETADFIVYTPLRSRGYRWQGILVSALVGDVVDSVLFLALAFHSFDFLPGQLIGKWAAIIVYSGFVAWRGHSVLARNASPKLG